MRSDNILGSLSFKKYMICALILNVEDFFYAELTLIQSDP